MQQQDDDPFSFSPDPSRTVIMPTPGGRRRGGAAAVIPPTLTTTAAPPGEDLTIAGVVSANPLVRAGGPLFTLVRQLRSIRDHADVATLRGDVIEAIRRFQTDAQLAGVDQKTSAQACYALCALIDETILGTPWGLRSIWGKQSLLITFYREATAGETFFNFLHKARESPRNYLDILEFFYICLSLGFQGKFRVEPGGADRLTRLRQDLLRGNHSRARRSRAGPVAALAWRSGPITTGRPLPSAMGGWHRRVRTRAARLSWL